MLGAPEASGEAPTDHSRAGQERFGKRLRASLGAQRSSQEDKGFTPLAGFWGGGQLTLNNLGHFGDLGGSPLTWCALAGGWGGDQVR